MGEAGRERRVDDVGVPVCADEGDDGVVDGPRLANSAERGGTFQPRPPLVVVFSTGRQPIRRDNFNV